MAWETSLKWPSKVAKKHIMDSETKVNDIVSIERTESINHVSLIYYLLQAISCKPLQIAKKYL